MDKPDYEQLTKATQKNLDESVWDAEDSKDWKRLLQYMRGMEKSVRAIIMELNSDGNLKLNQYLKHSKRYKENIHLTI